MKNRNLKRFASTALAGAMALSLAAPAFAADDNTTVITGEYKAITLAVTVPGSADALINPYGLPIDMPDDETVISGEQITTAAPLVLANQSEVDLKVSANISITATGDTAIITDATKVDTAESDGTTIKKNVCVNFEAFAAPGVDDDNYDDEDELSPMFAALKSEDADLKVVLDSATARDAEGTLILRKGDDEAIQDGGAAFVRLSGAVAKTPTTPWAATDGFKATITYTFEPSTYTKNVTLTSAGDATTVVAGSTLGVSVDLPEGVTSVSDVKWTSSSTTYVTVTEGSVSNGKLTATLNGAKSGTTIAKISVTFVGNDGITYQSDELSIKCVAS